VKHGLYAKRILPGEAEVLKSIEKSVGSLENEAVLARLLLHRVVDVIDRDGLPFPGGLEHIVVADRLLGRIVRIEEAREGLVLEEIERLKYKLEEAIREVEQHLDSLRGHSLSG
jgi:hypothetical protein